jgi:hypothetical protein
METINQFLANPDDADPELFQDQILKLDVSVFSGSADSGLELTQLLTLLAHISYLADSTIDALVSIIQKLCVNITLDEAISLQEYIISAFTNEDARVRLLAIRSGVENPARKHKGSWAEFIESDLFLNLTYCLGRFESIKLNFIERSWTLPGLLVKLLWS